MKLPILDFVFILAITGSTMTACRVGNNVTQAPAAPNPDTISGYYETQPQTLHFCVTINGESQCKPAAINLIPSALTSVFTDPVILLMDNLNTGSANFVDSDTATNALPIGVDGTKLSLAGKGSSPSSFFGSQKCYSQLYVSEEGSFDQSQISSRTINGHPMSGRIQLDVQVIESIEGDCVGLLQSAGACALDALQCGGATTAENNSIQEEVLYRFKPYLDSGAMTVNDIANVSMLAYEVTYQ